MSRITAFLVSMLCSAPLWAACPVIEQTQSSVDDTDDTTQTFSEFASAPTSGNLGVLCTAIDGGGETVSTDPAGQTNFLSDDNPSDTGLFCWYKVLDGTETGGTDSWTNGSNERSASVWFEISGAEAPATQAPETGTAVVNDATTTIDPPAVTPTGGSKDYLVIVPVSKDRGDETISAFSTNYTGTGQADTVAAAGGAGIGWQSRCVTTSSEDPGTLTSSNGDYLSNTIAIHPQSGSNSFLLLGR